MKIFKYILMAALTLPVVSCVHEEEDLFNESAAQRVNTAVENYSELLESSESGWVMNFYPSHDGDMGGIVYTVQFQDGVVSMLSQEYPDADAAKSLYQVKGETEILLSFDTYTEIFHQYSEPLGSSYPTGYESDYEFTFKSVSENQDTIMLKGKRYGQPLELIRLKEEPADYISKISTMYEKIAMLPHPIAIVNGTDEVAVDLSGGVFYFSEYVDAPVEWDAENKEFVEHNVPFITTEEGMKLQEPITINGQTFQECVYNDEDRSLTAVGANVVLPVILPEDYTEYADFAGEYTMYVRNGTVSFPITLTPDGDGSNYTITGMSNNFPTVKAKFNAATGYLEIHSQKVGEYNGNNVWLCCWDLAGGGSLTWSETAAVNLVRDVNEETLTFNFKPNNAYDADFNTDSFILWSTTAAGASAGQFTTWRFNGVNSNQMRYLTRIVKQ